MAQALLYHYCVHTYSGRKRHTYIIAHSPRLHFINIGNKHKLLHQREITLNLHICISQPCTHIYTHTQTHKVCGFRAQRHRGTKALLYLRGAHRFMDDSNKGEHAAYTTVQGHGEEKCVETHKRCVHTHTHSNFLSLKLL